MPKAGSGAQPSESAAWHLALKGSAAIEQIQASVRARELLAEGLVPPAAGIEPSRYAWETADDPPSDALPGVCLAVVDDFATGEGLSVYFVAGFARGENAFRRSIALELGANLPIGQRSGRAPARACLPRPCFSRRAFDRPGKRSIAARTGRLVARYCANYS
ncbi:hypothetical protein [Novosphingobium sp. M1R2S20]|uniref:Uncharacterized protein n=1 Tax=Novosphingobium rhizovicinum TaxID=3228928 RepID=A0ABV3R7U9_9SPHN